MLFPPEQLQLILQLTNNELAMARKNYTMAGEIVKFFGVMLLVTWFEFGSRASLWCNTIHVQVRSGNINVSHQTQQT